MCDVDEGKMYYSTIQTFFYNDSTTIHQSIFKASFNYL